MQENTETPQPTPIETPKLKTLFDADLSQGEFERIRRGEEIPAAEGLPPPLAEITEVSEAPEEVEIEAEEPIETEEFEELAASAEGISEKPKKEGGFKKRIKKLSAQKAELEREKEYWRQKALATPTPVEAASPKTESEPTSTKGKPKADEFGTHEEFVEALTDWKLEQKLLAKEAQAKEQAVKSEYQTRLQKHNERVSKFAEAHDDFEEVVNEVKVPMSLTVQEAILNSDHGPEFMYHFAKNQAELKRISEMPAIQAAMELGRLEAKFAKPQAQQTSQKKTTSAPPPITPVRTRGNAQTKSIFDPDISQAEFERLRREQTKKRA